MPKILTTTILFQYRNTRTRKKTTQQYVYRPPTSLVECEKYFFRLNFLDERKPPQRKVPIAKISRSPRSIQKWSLYPHTYPGALLYETGSRMVTWVGANLFIYCIQLYTVLLYTVREKAYNF